jgi:hypothetical protein
VRAEFRRKDRPDEVAGTVEWRGGRALISSDDEGIRRSLSTVFRPTPVLDDDPALRSAGTRGPVVLQPGTLGWFTAAARARADAEGLSVRMVPGSTPGAGWDPAGSYRSFQSVVERVASSPNPR